jgi:predicted DNA-binding transcriptional regulator YafY
MRYQPAVRLLRLAIALAGSRTGLSLDEMAEFLEVNRRTAERLRNALGETFPQLTNVEGDDRIRRWRLPREALPHMAPRPPIIATLDAMARDLDRQGDAARALDLRDAAAMFRAAMRPEFLRRSEPDIEALMQAEGSAATPGPRRRLDPDLLATIRHCILACRKLAISYRSAEQAAMQERTLCPYGVLYGRRGYLVAHLDGTEAMRLWRLDRIGEARALEESFPPRDFDLGAYAAQSFGVFQEPPETIVLRFTPDAAADAAAWQFHPSQVQERDDDGALIVRFSCGGLQELAWHLMTWGDSVAILAPKRLAELIATWPLPADRTATATDEAPRSPS